MPKVKKIIKGTFGELILDIKEESNIQTKIELISGSEGNCLTINDYRICGSKPWGGGTVVQCWQAKTEDIIKSIYIPPVWSTDYLGAARRIQEHMRIHKMNEPRAVRISDDLQLAVQLLYERAVKEANQNNI